MQRRSLISNCTSNTALLGSTDISAVGQTVTGAIVNLSDQSNSAEWELLVSASTGTYPVQIDSYTEFLLCYGKEGYYDSTWGSTLMSATQVKTGSSMMINYYTGGPVYYVTATFNISDNTVTITTGNLSSGEIGYLFGR